MSLETNTPASDRRLRLLTKSAAALRAGRWPCLLAVLLPWCFAAQRAAAADIWADLNSKSRRAPAFEDPLSYDDSDLKHVSAEDEAEVTSPRSRSLHSDESSGMDARFEHLAFKTFGREFSITNLELFPYVMDDGHILFGDFRSFVSNIGEFGGNYGLGYRQWIDEVDHYVGGSLWYDADHSTGKLFQQLAFNLHAGGMAWDVNSNFYFPVGNRYQTIASSTSNYRYSGTGIGYDSVSVLGESMRGLDVELGVVLPWQFARDRSIRMYGGWYHFLSKFDSDINGAKARIEGYLNDEVSVQVQYTNDNMFGSNLMVGAAITFTGGHDRSYISDVTKTSLMRRMTNRNYNVIVGTQTNRQYDIAAINPSTGTPWTVSHVSSSQLGAGTGDFNNPFATIAEAQTGSSDLILVRADSVFNQAVVLQPGEVLVGEGANYPIELQGIGTVPLPAASVGTNLPSFQGIVGDAITLANDSVVAGFKFDGVGGNAIAANGVNNATLADLSVVNATGGGISLIGSSGQFDLTDIDISGVTGTALHIDGGTANINISGQLANSAGRAIVIENATSGTLDLTDLAVTDTGGQGILVSNFDAAVHFNDLTVKNSTQTGISVQGGAGTVSFAGTTNVQNAAGSGVDIQNTTGNIYFENLNVDSNAQTGLYVRNASSLEIDRGKFTAINGGSAVDVQDSTIDIVLESVNVDGGPFGIRLINTPGRFFLAGDSTNVGSAGLIQNTTTGLIADNVESLTVQLADFDSNGTAISAKGLNELTVTSTSITNSTALGIDALNAQSLNVSQSVFTGNGSTDIRAHNDVVSSYSYNILQNTFSNASSDAIQIASLAGGEGANLSAMVRDNSITLNGAGATGLNVDWNGVAVVRAIHNNFIGTAANNTAVDLTSNHLTALSQYFVQQNTMTFSGTNATGFLATTAGPSQTTANENTITFNAAQGTGLRFNLAESANVAIYDNLITDNVSRGTGILFDSLDGPSNVTIMNNRIQLLSADSFVDQGIIFSSITDTVTLYGNESNSVVGASTVFSIPLGTSTGSFVINNFRVP